MFHDVLLNVSLLFFIVLSLTAKSWLISYVAKIFVAAKLSKAEKLTVKIPRTPVTTLAGAANHLLAAPAL